MMGRVDMGRSYSESVLVGDRYEAHIEEHPGVSYRNLKRVG